MLRELSIFTGAEDLRLALDLLHRTASATVREISNAAPLVGLAEYYASERGHGELLSLAGRLDVDTTQLPGRAETAKLFREELLSARALALHHGRNVYSSGKARLWHGWWTPFRDALTPSDPVIERTSAFVAQRTDAGGADVALVVEELSAQLRALGFSVEVHARDGSAPLLMARRSSRGLAGRAVLYGHYDVAEPDPDDWSTAPWELTERGGRLYGVGVGDNKGALAHRLWLLDSLESTPELLWIIQGEEEVGSPLAHDLLPSLLADVSATVWVEENGYFDADGTERLLAMRIGETPSGPLPPDTPLWRLIERFGHEADKLGIGHRVECRGLNKSFFPRGCPWRRAIPKGERYIAFGLNDPDSRIHRADESVPMWTFPVHAAHFATLMSWVGEEASK